jgi:hypothetical protein
MGAGSNVCEVDIGSDRGLSELSLEDTSTGRLVWQRNVDKSVKTTRSAKCVVELLGSVGSANDEDVLL